jgi:hypothetical protein
MTLDSFTDALHEFSTGPNYNKGAVYYTSYLCKPVPNSPPENAMSKAVQGAVTSPEINL